MPISIVMPVLDEATTIVAALEALQPLRRAGHEVIVVDGGSRDATCSLAESRADDVAVTPRGRALQMNAGAARARGDALVFLHADTRLPDTAAGAVEQALRSGYRWGRFDVRIEGRSMLLPVVTRAMNLRSRLSGIATGDQAMFVERRLFDDAGGYAAIPLMEDIELSARLKRMAGAPARIASPVTTSGRRWDSNGALRTIVAMWRTRLDHWRGVPVETLARRYYAPHPPALLVFAKDPQ
ncbi:MAG TPA: TIGR04283 family arsenosugar biosynthesis glycosyltransferase, partial [Casimicrobiaceae bacterium]|nr:TIGR04283 family arsenosugar biosynthesis glycosyltransferase [Casimicrobiaceae bacterium]